MSLKIFGERVALKPVEEKFGSGIILRPANRNVTSQLGEIVALSESASKVFKPGQICWFQVAHDLRTGAKICPEYQVEDTSYLIQHYRDLIAILDGPVVKLENFSIAGEWCLVKAELIPHEGRLLLPDSIKTNQEFIRYRLVQKGPTVDLEINVGDELIVEKNRCNPIEIDGEQYFYITKMFVYGVA